MSTFNFPAPQIGLDCPKGGLATRVSALHLSALYKNFGSVGRLAYWGCRFVVLQQVSNVVYFTCSFSYIYFIQERLILITNILELHRKGAYKMKTRTAFKISLYAILAYFAEFILYQVIDFRPWDRLVNEYPLIFHGLNCIIISLIIASVISGLLGFFAKKKSVSIWVFLGIFIAGIAYFSFLTFFT